MMKLTRTVNLSISLCLLLFHLIPFVIQGCFVSFFSQVAMAHEFQYAEYVLLVTPHWVDPTLFCWHSLQMSLVSIASTVGSQKFYGTHHLQIFKDSISVLDLPGLMQILEFII